MIISMLPPLLFGDISIICLDQYGIDFLGVLGFRSTCLLTALRPQVIIPSPRGAVTKIQWEGIGEQ